ncbi:MAG: peptide synthase, partial [Rubripirellula sp.]
FEGVQWRVIEVSDDPIAELNQTVEVERGKIGELMVAGPMVTRQYVVRSDQNAMHKVADGTRIWHRMGDLGYLDQQDRFWFCGRKAHRVTTSERTLYTIPCEAIFNAHPKVYRSALIGLGPNGQQTPLILIELHPEFAGDHQVDHAQLTQELLELAARNPLTRRIERVVIRDEPLPVDIRHNSKIFRERLAEEYTDR